MAATAGHKRLTLNAEAGYLRDVAISMSETDPTKQAMKGRELQLAADRHSCGVSCIYINLRPGEEFTYRGSKWAATGSVYVCKRMAKSHACDDYCNDYEVMSRGEGAVCRIRGVQLFREFSLARSRLDPDIRVVGPLTYTTHTFYEHADEGEEPRQQRDYEEDEADENDKKDEEEAWTCGTTVYETLLKRANNNEADVKRVIERFPTASTAELYEQIDKRVEWRRCAEAVWRVHAMSAKYREIQHRKAEADTLMWEKYSVDYITKCIATGIEPDLIHIMRLWMIYVRNSYQSIYVGGDIEETNRRNSVYYIECMLRLWEKYETLPIARERRVTFSLCCTALLKSLQEGLTIPVWFVGSNPKPRRSGGLTKRERDQATMTSVQMIRAHPELKLVPPDVIRAVNNKNKAAKTIKTGRCRLIGGKLAFPNRQRNDLAKKRSRDVHSQCIPPQKYLCNIMDDIVQHSKNLDELLTYSF
jgi:hypothetical protein